MGQKKIKVGRALLLPLPVSRPAPEESEKRKKPVALRVILRRTRNLGRTRNVGADRLVTRVAPPCGEIGSVALKSFGATLLPIIHLAALAAFWWPALFPFVLLGIPLGIPC